MSKLKIKVTLDENIWEDFFKILFQEQMMRKNLD